MEVIIMKKSIKTLLLAAAFVVSLFAALSVSADAKAAEDWDSYYIYRVDADVLNVRSGCGTNYPAIGQLTRNCVIRGNGIQSDGWVYVIYNGVWGCISSQYVTQTARPLTGYEQVKSLGLCRTTGYDICYSCCGGTSGITASGTRATTGRSCGMKGVPFGSRIYIEGIGYRIVEDTGYIGYNHVDIMCDNHYQCSLVTGYHNVYVIQ